MGDNKDIKGLFSKKVYFGHEQVIAVSKVDSLSVPSGEQVLELHLGSGRRELTTEPVYKALASKRPVPAGDFQRKKFDLIVPRIVEVLLNHNIKAYELQSLLNAVGDHTQEAFNKASHILWTGGTDNYAPGSDFVLERTILDAERVLRPAPPQEENNDVEQEQSTPQPEEGPAGLERAQE